MGEKEEITRDIKMGQRSYYHFSSLLLLRSFQGRMHSAENGVCGGGSQGAQFLKFRNPSLKGGAVTGTSYRKCVLQRRVIRSFHQLWE